MTAMRIGIVGMGWVGASVASATLQRGLARELWLDDVRGPLALAEALDLAHGAAFRPTCDVGVRSVEAMAEACDAIVIAAGHGALPGTSRLDALASTAVLARDLGARLRGTRAVVVVVTNPVDVVTMLVAEASGLPPERVLGTGTVLDSARLRHQVATRLGLAEHSIDAHVLGEHGDSQVPVFSTASVCGVPLRCVPGWRRDEEPAVAESVRRAAYTIVAGKGATSHAIGLVTADLLQCIVRDERRVLTVSRLVPAEPGFADIFGAEPVTLSLPTVVGRGGGTAVLVPQLDADERAALRRSADVLRAAARPHLTAGAADAPRSDARPSA